ncbi:hypothetical protein E2562_037522 [Oryza meyeriana var. granulata]|uniref:Disease resistance N-terminal domain-containing protein n=1 Tax=Oryza meyeriana var. granulata TaxID=110450 RepID=A0A6G1CBI4_9ORYZ|nr:hypothetical protein E2562_037522 [Oryza meyeriana var. granulata]
MAGIFASMAIRKALDTLSSYLPTSSSSTAAKERQKQDLEDLRMLERTMHRIHATLHDAEQHWNIREETSKLRLKDLAYDAEEVVDEYESEVNRCKAEALELSESTTNHKRKRQQKQENKALFYDSGMAVVPDELAVKTRKLIERFQEMKYYSDNFTLSENDGERRLAPGIGILRKTSCIVFEQSILGREKDNNVLLGSCNHPQ